ncbi:MAG: HYR domain-containing protein, partial [bacterium]|nr:HYR domain-containing protein [bacterium]
MKTFLRKSTFLTTVFLIANLFFVNAAFGQTLTSDQADYAPGSTATLTGMGFTPGETVTLQVMHADATPGTGEDHGTWYVIADENGNFVTTWHVCEDDCLDSTLRATALGQSSGLSAEVLFTDASSISATWTEGTLTIGTSSNGLNNSKNYRVDFVDPDGVTTSSATFLGSVVNPHSESKILNGAYRIGIWTINLMIEGSGVSAGTFSLDKTTTVSVTATGRKLLFTVVPASTCSGTETGQWTVTRQNGDGKAYIDGLLLAVNLTSSSSSGSKQFRATSGGASTLTVSIGALTSTATFFYFDGTGGSYTITGSATSHVNASTSYTINSLPSFTACPSNIVTNAGNGVCTAVVSYTATITGTPSPTVSYVFTGATTGSGSSGTGSGSTFNKGTTTVTITATNTCGTATCSFTVTVNDSQNPTISCPGNIVKSNDAGVCGAVVTYAAPVGTDNCIGSITAQTTGLASGSTFPIGITTNTFKVTDASGNTSTCSFTVTVNDTQNPSITCPSNIVKSNDAGVCGAVVTYTAPVGTDNCTGTITTQTTGLASGSTFPIGITTNTFKVIDASGNTSTCSFTVTINDIQNPSISCPGNIVKSNDAGVCGAVVTYTKPVGTDNCPGSATIQTTGLVSGSTFP